MIRVVEDSKNKKTLVTIAQLPGAMDRELSAALYEMGIENVRHLRRLFKAKDKTGRIYIIDGRKHRASAPGQAPASRSGRLARTAKYIVRGTSQMEFGDMAPYGVYLEEGTKHMEPRPHIEATVIAKQKDTYRSLLDAQDRALGIR